jgi:hypothetical protein
LPHCVILWHHLYTNDQEITRNNKVEILERKSLLHEPSEGN